MKRTARIARTAHGLTHQNRLHVPEFWVTKLRLELGGKTSITHVQPGAPDPDGSGSNNFNFAPEKETPELKYTIDDPRGTIRSAKLELFTRYNKDALWSFDLTQLGLSAYTHGDHVLKWDGRLPKLPDDNKPSDDPSAKTPDLTSFDADPKAQEEFFPDGYVTVGESPYKLRMIVSDDENDGGKVVAAWTYFHVLLKKIELELGPENSLPKATVGKPDNDLLVFKDTDAGSLNGALPADGATSKLFLTSNIFKNSNGQMHDQSDFNAYKDLWGEGPQVPIFAKVWVRDSADQAVEAPKALGKAKFLWDAEDVAESSGSVYAGHHAKAKSFLDDSVNYDKDVTKPKGDNCHKDRGGKRGDDTKFFFPKQDGYGYGFGGDFDSDPEQASLKVRTFPFKVEPCKKRKWSSYSYAWTRGTLANKTGVLFQPSRLGGDAYKVTVYLAYDKMLDGGKPVRVIDAEDNEMLKKPDAAVKKTTGVFEVWRRLMFVRYMKKKAGVTPNFPIGTFQNYYKQAFVNVRDDTGGATNMVKADYDGKVTAAIAARTNWYEKHMLSTTVASHYDAGLHALHFNNFATFKSEVKTAKGWNDTQLNAFLGTVLNTEALYNAWCGNVASDTLTGICEQYMHADPGINLFHFNEHYNLATAVGGSTLNGFAPGAAVGPHKGNTTNDQCLFVLCAGPTNYNGSNNRAEQTVAHEIGHCLFMAHAPVQTATDDANKHDVTVHDKDFNNCLMSYNYDAERKWCGFCILRLRGWDRGALKNDRTQNKKP